MSLKQRIQDRIEWLKATADGGTPPCAEERIMELTDVLSWLAEIIEGFPKLTPEIEKQFPIGWPLYLNEKRLDWFRKNFGDLSK